MCEEQKQVFCHVNAPLHIHLENTEIPGVHHSGIYVGGGYSPEHSSSQNDYSRHHILDHTDHSYVCGPMCRYERFTRLLNASMAGVRKTKSESGTKKNR